MGDGWGCRSWLRRTTASGMARARAAIRRLVEFRVQCEHAGRAVAEQGAIVAAKRTKVPQINPHWVVMRQADDVLKVLEAELGIAPTRRGRAAKVKREKKTERASDRYLKPVTCDGPQRGR